MCSRMRDQIRRRRPTGIRQTADTSKAHAARLAPHVTSTRAERTIALYVENRAGGEECGCGRFHNHQTGRRRRNTAGRIMASSSTPLEVRSEETET